MTLLALDQVTKRFNGIPAVDAVSFSVDRGQVVGFLGPNGAGKSTTMRMITQYHEPDQGRITFDGKGGATPAAALTAYAREEDQAQAFAAGYQMHISKPIAPIQLVTMVAKLAGRQTQAFTRASMTAVST